MKKFKVTLFVLSISLLLASLSASAYSTYPVAFTASNISALTSANSSNRTKNTNCYQKVKVSSSTNNTVKYKARSVTVSNGSRGTWNTEITLNSVTKLTHSPATSGDYYLEIGTMSPGLTTASVNYDPNALVL